MSNQFPRPWATGVIQGPNWQPLDTRAVSELRVGATQRLRELCDDFAFYTPAILFKLGLAEADPFDTFCAEHNGSWQQASLRLERPVFRGLDIEHDPEWNYVLFAIQKQLWEQYRAWLGTVAFSDMQQRLARVRFMDIQIVDPLCTIVAGDPPLLPCVVLCVETNSGSGLLSRDPLQPWLPPQYVWRPGLRWSNTQAFLQAVVQEKPDPYQEAENNASHTDPPH